ncbi:Methyltransferase domain-containing protein [Actinopolymorpha cephalotaxi]|uniref:Methyltransferase domain-containing protein n=1 Tax=Actinopolymorpha cephalotaxi TaxID=504797 RepID=A0A1I2KDY1_9ACTN|nr:class I SAM-dependent methyltransferase [Actinopolymorpha cephalotaxi]NYH81154.1 SAM-dependent methyltransferase [Actinopolymorpha cephalotaxi]SFF65252.1 Methyltransferase domain-containing protein [Actinopolymorpha cephalotaxi]
MDQHTTVNQAMWNELAPLHAASDYYDVESFLRGKSTLGALELAEVGDVTGKRLLHLMCHFGMDTLSWVREGAQVTGVDFSEEAIGIARDLATRTNTEAEFVVCDVLAAADHLNDTYDVVFLSKGVLMWIGDLDAWAATCARLLRPGGVLYVLDYHPLAMALSESGSAEGGLTLHGSYFGRADPTVVVKDGSYAVSDAGMAHQESREWTHTLGEVVTAVARAGITIEFLHEFPARAGGMPMPNLDRDGVRDELPAMFSVRAVRAGG